MKEEIINYVSELKRGFYSLENLNKKFIKNYSSDAKSNKEIKRKIYISLKILEKNKKIQIEPYQGFYKL